MDKERFAWIQLALTPYIGAESFVALIHHYGSAQNALNAPFEEIRHLIYRSKQAKNDWCFPEKARKEAEKALEWEKQNQCRLLLLCDEDYPSILSEGQTPPPLLFTRGNIELLHRPSVAIVGSRHATPQAMRIAHDFANELSANDITVVSGMASGIDTAAHQGALKNSGSTIAIWGTGIDRIYPQNNKNLAYEIAEKGLIISEFPLGTRPLAGNFPRRNRLIAAQASATLVVEAALESGSLITAKLAAEMGREVMAVPGSIDNPHCKGCHKLIKEGAKLVECLDDILSECIDLNKIFPKVKSPLKKGNSRLSTKLSTDKKLYHSSENNTVKQEKAQQKATHIEPLSHHDLWNQMGFDPIHPDVLAEETGLAADEIYACLIEWELEGKVAGLSGGRFQKI